MTSLTYTLCFTHRSSTSVANCSAGSFLSVGLSTGTLARWHRHPAVGDLAPGTPSGVPANIVAVFEQFRPDVSNGVGARELC